MKRLMPGVYDDGEGGLHLDMAELLAANGYADTPENRATLLEVARAMCGGLVPVSEVNEPIVHDEPGEDTMPTIKQRRT